MSGARRTGARALVALLVLLALAAGWVAWRNVAGDDPLTGDAASFVATPEQVARGAYLARAGNCAACHTDRGGAAFAGGKGIATPFGTVYASNITPDARTGIGNWSAAQFWRAMHASTASSPDRLSSMETMSGAGVRRIIGGEHRAPDVGHDERKILRPVARLADGSPLRIFVDEFRHQK